MSLWRPLQNAATRVGPCVRNSADIQTQPMIGFDFFVLLSVCVIEM